MPGEKPHLGGKDSGEIGVLFEDDGPRTETRPRKGLKPRTGIRVDKADPQGIIRRQIFPFMRP